MPFLDKLTNKFGEMMKEKLGGSKEKEHESSESSHGEHQKSYAPQFPELPPGWIKQWDPNSQRYYYVEQATGRTQWDPPVGNYGPPPSDMHHLGGSVPGQYHSQEQRAMYEGSHGEEKKKDSHSGLAFAGGAALSAVGGAWAAHEYTEHEDEEKYAAENAQYQGADTGYGAPPTDTGYGYAAAPPAEQNLYVPEEGHGSDAESEAESVNEAAGDVNDAQEELAEASSESDREEAREDLEEAQEDYAEEREDYNEEVYDD